MISVLMILHHHHSHMALLDLQIQLLLATMLTAHQVMVLTHQHSMEAILRTLHFNKPHRQEVIMVQIIQAGNKRKWARGTLLFKISLVIVLVTFCVKKFIHKNQNRFHRKCRLWFQIQFCCMHTRQKQLLFIQQLIYLFILIYLQMVSR